MNPFVASQVGSIIEGLRLLEATVTAPLGLHSDIQMLRQAIGLEDAADLSRGDTQKRRAAYRRLLPDPAGTTLQTVSQIKSSVEILQGLSEAPLDREWFERAQMVLGRTGQKVAGDIRRSTAAKLKGLYVIVDPNATEGRPVAEIAEAALAGGASAIQLRDKSGDRGNVLDVARQTMKLCSDRGAMFIANDDPSLALSSDSDGLHLGQADLPLPEARRVLAPTQIVGLSNNSMDEVASSISLGADYLAVGAIFPTASVGKGDRAAVGPAMVARVREITDLLLVAIGGIDVDNVGEAVRAGADSVCVVSAVSSAPDPEAASRALVEAIENAKTGI